MLGKSWLRTAFIVLACGIAAFAIALACNSQFKHARAARAAAQIESENRVLRDQVAQSVTDLELALEKGPERADFLQRSRHIIALFRTHPNIWTPAQSDSLRLLDHKFDATLYFWERYQANTRCLPAEPMDIHWLREMKLDSDKEVWAAYDFEASYANIAASEERKTQIVANMADGALNQYSAGLLKQSELDAKQKHLDYELAHMDEILNAAARQRTHFNPGYTLHRLLLSIQEDCQRLLASVAHDPSPIPE